jgi:hypothetical protein
MDKVWHMCFEKINLTAGVDRVNMYPNDLSSAEKERLGSLKDMNLVASKAYNFKLCPKNFWKE